MFTGFGPNDLIFLLICFIPGFLSLSLSGYLVPTEARTDFDKVAMSTALGFTIFTVTILLGKVFRPTGASEVFYIIVPWLLIIPTGLMLSIFQSKPWILRIFKTLGFSKRTVGVSCWNVILTKKKKKANWVRLYLKNGTSYIGWVEVFSDTPPHEIVIHPIKMTSNEGITKYSFQRDDRMYVRADNLVCLESLSTEPESEG